MKFSMDNRCLECFTKNLRFMARNSNELFIEAKDNSLRLRVCNDVQTNVAVASYEEVFFLSFEKSANEEENFLRVSFNSLLSCLRNTKDIIGSCFSYDVGKDRLIVHLKKGNGVEVTHKINLLENEDLSEVINDADMNEITCHPSVFNRLQCKFVGDMQVVFRTGTVLLENFIENDEDYRTARLHFLLHQSEFHRYEVKQEVMLVFSWVEFMNVIELAIQLMCDVKIQFSKPGKPIIVNIDTGANYSIQIIQLTMTDVTIGRKRNQAPKVVAYKEYTNEFYKDREVSVESLEIVGVSSPTIYQTEDRQSQKNAQTSTTANKDQNVGITEVDMDNMIAASSFQQKRPQAEVQASVHLSQQEQNEMDILLEDLANFDDIVDEIEDVQDKIIIHENRLIHEQENEPTIENPQIKKGRKGRQFRPKPSGCINEPMVEYVNGTDIEDY